MTTAKDFLRLVRLAEERAEPEMEKAYRVMVDSGVVKYGEPVFVETYKKRGRKLPEVPND